MRYLAFFCLLALTACNASTETTSTSKPVPDRAAAAADGHMALTPAAINPVVAFEYEDILWGFNFLPDGREVEYLKENIVELDLAYAITIHKSQGSEFSAVIIPVLTQHFKMLYRNLIYTGLTRAKKLAVFVGTRRAMTMAVRQQDTALRQTALEQLLKGN